MTKTYKAFLALVVLLLVPASALSQERWTQIEKTDALRGTKSTRFTLEGKFVEAPQQSKMSSPTFVVDCDPNVRRAHGHQKGKLLDAYIAIGAVLDSKVDSNESALIGTRAASGLEVQYRIDDGKVRSEFWFHSKDFSAIFLGEPLGSLGMDYKDAVPWRLLYSHQAMYKENVSVPARKAVIRVSEYLGGNITVEFDLPDPTEVADACGLFIYKKKISD